MKNVESVRSLEWVTGIDWPEAVEFPADRVLSGCPSASTYVLHKDMNAEVGLRRASPGHFSGSRVGVHEIVTITDGVGRLHTDDGTVTDLRPGVSVVIPDGWRGSWQIESHLTKTYTIISTPR